MFVCTPEAEFGADEQAASNVNTPESGKITPILRLSN
jgi:hypothetical protein